MVLAVKAEHLVVPLYNLIKLSQRRVTFHLLQAQSIGGSGGNGGFAVAAALAGSIKFPSTASVALGGKGGKGGISGLRMTKAILLQPQSDQQKSY